MGKYLSATVEGAGSLRLDKEIARLLDPTPAWRAILAAWRGLIDEEFQRGAWRPPSGSFRLWQALQPFGSAPRGRSKLQRSGRLRRAWAGGSGSIERVTKTGVEFGVDGRAIPYAVVQRGTSGPITAATARQLETEIRVTHKAHVFLGMTYGVWKKVGSTIKIPARPHATVNPEIRTQATALLSAFVTGRALPGGFGASQRIQLR